MDTFQATGNYLSSAFETLETLTGFCKFYKSVNDETAEKISKFIGTIQISEQCQGASIAMTGILRFMQDRAISHQEMSK